MADSIFHFGAGKADGSKDMRDLLGGKGANLAEMSSLGIPVPPGFTITTAVCNAYAITDALPQGFTQELQQAVAVLEGAMQRSFGDTTSPLLVSVRSGAKFSMPGMMDTVLNLGLNSQTVKSLAAASNNERFAYDSYRRFIQMYANVVRGVDTRPMEELLTAVKKKSGVKTDADLSATQMRDLAGEFLQIYADVLGEPFPEDPWEQLLGAIKAVFQSWSGRRAKVYRRLHNIPDSLGTACNIQCMVFGNLGNDSATGVAFTRNPSTGARHIYGEYLINAQGEDVVAGIRTPQPIRQADAAGSGVVSMEESMPALFKELTTVCAKLERHYVDMQDVEFTIEAGKLWLLQTRNGKRTAEAALKIASDLVKENIIDKKTALMRVQPDQLEQLLHPTIDPNFKRTVLVKGLAASPGAGSGRVTFDADEAEKRSSNGEKVILVREETSPEDIHGMYAAVGILTSTGGLTSHAAVVARGMGKPCIVGCNAIHVDSKKQEFATASTTVKDGDLITIDGSSGEVMLGEAPLIEAQLDENLLQFLQWSDQHRRLRVRANADTPQDAQRARELGAEGIGLCRTEHMFFDENRIALVRKMILVEKDADREEILQKLLGEQRQDFVEIFKAMSGLPVTIRLLDPPLHEFLPHDAEGVSFLSKKLDFDSEWLRSRINKLTEFNPMLGHRGCRLGITFPQIYDMQVQAIVEAACEVEAKAKGSVLPEIMIPLVGAAEEFHWLQARAEKICKEVLAKSRVQVSCLIGTMIEIPRAALTAGEIAEHAQFFSFGTNDLTQTALGMSRDDAGKFLDRYIEIGIYKRDPFSVLDQPGIGRLVRLACEEGRAARGDLKLGICGEHGGDPSSVRFFHEVGLDYVSCSTFRVPVARLAAAQAGIAASP